MPFREQLTAFVKDAEEKIKKTPLGVQEQKRLREDLSRLADIAALRDKQGNIPLDVLAQAVETLKQTSAFLESETKKMPPATVRKKKSPERRETTEDLQELIETVRAELETKLNDRAKACGSSLEFTIAEPAIPENVTVEHLDSVREILGSGMELRMAPTVEDLHNFDQDYVDLMYPENQRPEDTAAGLLSYRPSWFSQRADEFADHRPPADRGTWGEAYLRSMRQELNTLGNSVVFVETTQKPNYTNGEQHYGTEEGTNTSTDPLLPLFQEVFGENANRFNHTWGELETQLLPKIKEKIIQSLQKKHLPIPNFDVILLPASISNIEMTLYHPENSTTNTYEWTSTPLIDDINNDTGYRLAVGDSDGGGAGDVDDDRRDHRNVGLGTRLAVVFKPTDH